MKFALNFGVCLLVVSELFSPIFCWLQAIRTYNTHKAGYKADALKKQVSFEKVRREGLISGEARENILTRKSKNRKISMYLLSTIKVGRNKPYNIPNNRYHESS